LLQKYQRSSKVIPNKLRQTKPLRRKIKVKRRFLVMLALGLALGLAGAPAWGDDFFVIAGGGTSGKVLKTQVFTSSTQNKTQGTSDWAKLDSPLWTYTKLSATSYLVITYQDNLSCTGGMSVYQLRVNDQPSVAGAGAALLFCNAFYNTYNMAWNTYGATGVWSELPKGDLTLSIWHAQVSCTACTQNPGGVTSVIVMEIEK
jgi:hypothetical protein